MASINDEYWDNENACKSDSEEFKYLDDIENTITKAKKIVNDLEKIYEDEHWNVKLNNKKDIIDFTEIKNKLTEIQNIID